MSTVEVRGLTKSFAGRPPVPALRGVDLDVRAGALTAVLGPSGCGKTTLLRLIAGFERPDAGTVSVAGRTVVGEGTFVAPERRAVGIVPQEGALFPHLDVGANVAFGLRGRPREERRERVGELLDLVGLTGYERRRPDQLSGGQQQRVALARALAPGPEVVLLDEPFTALDAGLRASVREQVADLLLATGTTAVLVTHDQDEAFALADVVAVMRAGRIVQAGSPRQLYQHPADLETARFLGEAVEVPGTLHGGRVDCALGSLPVDPGPVDGPVAGSVVVLVRPEAIRLDDAARLKATVASVRFHGDHVVVALDLGGVHLRARWSGDADVHRGDTVGIAVAGPVSVFT